MELYDFITKNREKLESVFDLAAICYDHLLKKVKRIGQPRFIGEYLCFSKNEKEDGKYNPNLMMLRKFTDQIVDVLHNQSLTMDEKLDDILDFISSTRQHLENFGTKACNEATISYHLLLAIDLYVEHHFADSRSAPLNEGYQTNAYIYSCQKGGMISKASEKLEFRKPILPTEVRSNFTCLRILEKAELMRGMNPPKMITLYIDEEDEARWQIVRGQTLNVAIIPFGRKDICSTFSIKGEFFGIEYMEAHRKTGIGKALRLLESAIENKANIVVFPEYVCSPEIQEAISTYLTDTNSKDPNKINQLLLVIAGSGWTKDNNNICKIYSYSGKLLGEYYKHAPFTDEVEALMSDGQKRASYALVEGLHNPGKESVVVQIPTIGSVMVAICRDISERGLSERMARIFRTDFLMVPAYSKSIHHGFLNQLKNITETNINTCSVVCNCCDGIEDKKWHATREVGMVIMPCKSESLVEGKEHIISVRKSEWERCNACDGCIFRLIISFQAQDIENGKMVYETQIFS